MLISVWRAGRVMIASEGGGGGAAPGGGGQAGGDERGEDEDQDDGGDRQRDDFGPLEVLLGQLGRVLLDRPEAGQAKAVAGRRGELGGGVVGGLDRFVLGHVA